MKPSHACFAKASTGPPSGGGGSGWSDISSAPLGVPIQVRIAGGEPSVAVRDSFLPVWQDGSRAMALAFTPDEWRPIAV